MSNRKNSNSEIILYQPENRGEVVLYQPDSSIKLEVWLEDETVWLSQAQIGELFGRDRTVISRHIRNIFYEGELIEDEVSANFAHTTQHGAIKGKTQDKIIKQYNLDVIISVGYRIKSKLGTAFRIWAREVIKDYLLRGYAINHRIERVERFAIETEKRVTETENKIDFFVKTSQPPLEGIFYDGQTFDAYVFVANLIKTAKNTITLIDNYIDESVLLLLTKRQTGVEATVYTKNISPELQLDIQRHNSQYPPITVCTFTRSHDRFLIIDDDVYLIGASIKDLGKKWFGFTKMVQDANSLRQNMI